MSLSPARLDRFARHIVLPEVGAMGQAKLAQSHVVLIGMAASVRPRCSISREQESAASR